MSMVKRIRIEVDNYNDDHDDDCIWDETMGTLDRIVKDLHTDYSVETYMNGVLVSQ